MASENIQAELTLSSSIVHRQSSIVYSPCPSSLAALRFVKHEDLKLPDEMRLTVFGLLSIIASTEKHRHRSNWISLG